VLLSISLGDVVIVRAGETITPLEQRQ